MTNYRHIDTTARSVIFANPLAITDTLRFNVSTATKNVGSAKIPNVKSEIKSNSVAPVLVGETNVGDEAIAVSTTISGSLTNKDLVKKKVLVHLTAVQQFLDDLVAGWKPDSDAKVSTSL